MVTQERGTARDLTALVLAMCAAQFLFLFATLTVPLFTEGLIFGTVGQAARHALERAPAAAGGIAVVVTAAHVARIGRSQQVTAASLRSVRHREFGVVSAELQPEALDRIRTLPGVRSVRPSSGESSGDAMWEVDLRRAVRWYARVAVGFAAGKLVVRTSPRYPLLFPGVLPRSRTISALINAIEAACPVRPS